MSVKPILFNTEMVKAILDGRKSCTRRIMKPHNHVKASFCGYKQGDGFWIDGYSKNDEPNGHIKDYSVSSCWIPKESYIEKYAPYHVGDILYVRETWYADGNCRLYKADNEKLTGYRDINGNDVAVKWHPSIHMPKKAARIWLKVTNVGVERLQDIDGKGILSEGFDNGISNPSNGKRWENMQWIGFKEIWDSTVNKTDLDTYGWNANPYIWVIEFERCEKPEEIT